MRFNVVVMRATTITPVDRCLYRLRRHGATGRSFSHRLGVTPPARSLDSVAHVAGTEAAITTTRPHVKSKPALAWALYIEKEMSK